jgi:hypothetical protein
MMAPFGALQYSLRPSFLSLDRVGMGREQNRALLHAWNGGCRACWMAGGAAWRASMSPSGAHPAGRIPVRRRVRPASLPVPIIHPCWSGSMSILAEGAAEPVSSADIEVRDLFRIGNRFRERAQWCGSPESPVGPVLIIEVLELPERVQQVTLVPDERAV